jgi:UDP-N-acetylmuramoylalanine--D-glutamate ligase
MAGGTEVLAWDDQPAQRAAATAAGVAVTDLGGVDWHDIAALVLSPGVPLHYPAPHPFVRRAETAQCEILGDVELFARTLWPQGRRAAGPRLVGVTGTNGKSTTTALIGHLLAAGGCEVAVGGNIGRPVLNLPRLGADGIYVLELSSYQLDLVSSLRPDVAVLLNIAPDHLDRHGSFEDYIAAKRRLFVRQTAPQTAIIGVDDPQAAAVCADLMSSGAAHVVPIATTRPLAGGVFVAEGALFDATDGAPARICDLRALPSLPGTHNWQNAAAAFAAARALGLQAGKAAAALATFPGLPHRMEAVACVDGVRFVNDSKATNADATARALACHDNVFLILGGLPKAGGLAALRPLLERVRQVYLIGTAADAFAAELGGRVPLTRAGSLAVAVEQAARDAWRAALPDAVVLLSPACASFDQFRDFEARGDAFRALVHDLVARQHRRGVA